MIYWNETVRQKLMEVCKDFDIFCDYLLQDSVKLSKKT